MFLPEQVDLALWLVKERQASIRREVSRSRRSAAGFTNRIVAVVAAIANWYAGPDRVGVQPADSLDSAVLVSPVSLARASVSRVRALYGTGVFRGFDRSRSRYDRS